VLSDRRVAALTGITLAQWADLRRAFPALPAGAGPRAAARRVLLARLASRRLATGRWSARLAGPPPSPGPCLYVSAHLGSLQALRYTLRARGVLAANVLGPHNLERPEAERQDRLFDERFPLPFPHFLPAARVHRLRTALRSGSLIAAADLPAAQAWESPLLGGRVRLDPRPFRLARAAGVPCRPAFLTIPRGRWTLTLGARLPEGEHEALEAYAGCLRETAAKSPLDLDAFVYWNLSRRG